MSKNLGFDGIIGLSIHLTSAEKMTTNRFEPSSIKNKIKREEVVRKSKKAKTQAKLQKRLAQAKLEANDPAAKKVRMDRRYPQSMRLRSV